MWSMPRVITDDGSMPDGQEGEVLAEEGARGVITMIGHVEDQPGTQRVLGAF